MHLLMVWSLESSFIQRREIAHRKNLMTQIWFNKNKMISRHDENFYFYFLFLMRKRSVSRKDVNWEGSLQRKEQRNIAELSVSMNSKQILVWALSHLGNMYKEIHVYELEPEPLSEIGEKKNLSHWKQRASSRPTGETEWVQVSEVRWHANQCPEGNDWLHSRQSP